MYKPFIFLHKWIQTLFETFLFSLFRPLWMKLTRKYPIQTVAVTSLIAIILLITPFL